MKICGILVDIHSRETYPAAVFVSKGKIKSISRCKTAPEVYIIPGLIDAHIHIESSMVTPGAFAVAVVKHGTTGVVSDPHEIANVLGEAGVHFMIKDAGKVPVNFFFGAPSCVPATLFESSGAQILPQGIQRLLEMPEVKYLSEMMNFPGVILDDEVVYLKLQIAKKLNKPVDGHAPGLTGEKLEKYVHAGISTDHECSTMEEAMEKISLGMKVLIREGSAARNLNSLKRLFLSDPTMIMLCSDDLHPEMLKTGHINKLVAGLIAEGYDIFDVIRSATINPSEHYSLGAGLLRTGDNADFVVVDDLGKMNVLETWIKGKRVYSEGTVAFKYRAGIALNNFSCTAIEKNDIKVPNNGGSIRVIEAFEGELLTGQIIMPSGNSSFIEPDTEKDLLKIVVKDRYRDAPPAVGFIKGFGLKAGAFASSVAHDSHNIIAVGTNDDDIVSAVNEIVRLKGGLSVSAGNTIESLRLDIGGIMTTRSCDDVARDYEKLNLLTRANGCTMMAPFMTLSFMALLVIPELKIGDKGLFDVNRFELVSLFN
jgi:adenine deaminase